MNSNQQIVYRDWYNEALQTVESMTVQVTPCGNEIHYPGTLTFRFPGRFPGVELPSEERCQWSRCKDGGLELTKVISALIRRKQPHVEETVCCKGIWTSPKGRVTYDRCGNCWKIIVDIVFKPN